MARAKKEFLCLTLPDLGISIVDFDLRLYARFTFFTNIWFGWFTVFIVLMISRLVLSLHRSSNVGKVVLLMPIMSEHLFCNFCKSFERYFVSSPLRQVMHTLIMAVFWCNRLSNQLPLAVLLFLFLANTTAFCEPFW